MTVASNSPRPMMLHWQAVAVKELGTKQSIVADQVHVWWWPEDLQPFAATRRLRTDVILRTLLARYLPLEPAALRFARETRGRPYLLHDAAPDFNLSDTRGGCVIAVAGSGRVGIDIERCDRAPPVVRLADRWFAADEARALRGMDPESARHAFLRMWTAKEASCKATGTGIFGRLAEWRFAIDAHIPTPIALPPEAGSVGRWRFHRFVPAATHTVALACQDLTANPQGFVVCP
jgi:4'-phosphopantetheinyl transferase